MMQPLNASLDGVLPYPAKPATATTTAHSAHVIGHYCSQQYYPAMLALIQPSQAS